MEKYCKICNIGLTQDNVYISLWKRGSLTCKECCKLNYKKNITHERSALYSRVKNLTYKSQILSAYNNECQCCGEIIWQFLTIDHIDNDGAKHRREEFGFRRAGTTMYRWLKKHDYPKDNFRLLCMNCNACIGFHGFCSHKIPKNLGKCFDCSVILDSKNQFNFHKYNDTSLCKLCVLKRSRKYDTEEITKNYRTLLQRRKEGKSRQLILRQKLIEGYGRKCQCCGEVDYMFLTIDHINNDGTEERKSFKNDMNKFYRYLINNNFPKDNYQLLCYNCNCCRGFYGKCYHQLIKDLQVTNISITEYKDIIRKGLNV